MEEPSFDPELFAFLRELREHNDREWFNVFAGFGVWRPEREPLRRMGFLCDACGAAF